MLLFVPGWTMPAWIWAPQIAAFSRQYRVIAFDPRGQGESDAPPHGYDQNRRGQDIAELIARLRPVPVLAIGWSLGVLDTLAYVHTHGDRLLAGLVLVDNSVGEEPPPSLLARRRAVGRPAARCSDAPLRPGNVHRPQPAAYLERLTEATLHTPEAASRADTATDIAKESADLILFAKDLVVLEGGVIEGRKVFANILKYIRMGASSNFGNMFSVLGASAFLPFIPMAPIQVLTNNLLYDFSQVPIPIDAVDEEQVARPRPWNIDEIKRFILPSAPSAQFSTIRLSSSCSGSSTVGTLPAHRYFRPAGSSSR